MLRRAYRCAFTAPSIITAFERAGLWLVDHTKVMSELRPKDLDDTRTLASVEEKQRMFF